MSRGGFTSGGILSAGGGGGSPVFDSVSTSTANTSFPYTTAHTPVGTLSGVGVFVFNWTGGNTISGVTYGGAALTLITTQGTVTLWGSTVTPASGVQNVQVSGSTGGSFPCYSVCLGVTGGNVTAIGSSQIATGSTVPSSVTVSSAVGQLVCDILGYDNGNGANIVADASQTDRSNVGPGTGNLTFGVSTKPGAASVTMQWTLGFTTPTWNAIAASFQ